ncbi:MAG: hypothetical protein CM15mV52_0690 [uncultured marine virus]|nr:MAG: hypothetical protein CM15mV52_0690 [uncultured marine virus]
MVDATPGILTSLNTGSVDGGAGERVLIDYKEAIRDYRVTDLPVMQFFADPMTTDTGGDIDITFAKPSMAMEQIDEGNTPQYQHTKLRSERVAVKEWGLAVGVTRRMIEDSRFNEVEMALNEARRAVDRHMTNHVVKVIFGSGSADATFGTIAIGATTTEADITTFSSNPQGGFLGKDATFAGRLDQYADQTIAVLSGAKSYNNATNDTAGAIALSDIAAAISRMSKHGASATHLFISPAHYENLLKMADFASVFTNTMAVSGSVNWCKRNAYRSRKQPIQRNVEQRWLSWTNLWFTSRSKRIRPTRPHGYLRFIYQANGLRRKKTSNG